MPAMFLSASSSTGCSSPRSIADPPKRGVMVLMTFALALVIEGMLGFLFSNIYRSTRPPYASDAILLGPFYIPDRAALRDARCRW